MQPNSLAEDENLPYSLADSQQQSPKMSLKMPRGCFSVFSLMFLFEVFPPDFCAHSWPNTTTVHYCMPLSTFPIALRKFTGPFPVTPTYIISFLWIGVFMQCLLKTRRGHWIPGTAVRGGSEPPGPVPLRQGVVCTKLFWDPYVGKSDQWFSEPSAPSSQRLWWQACGTTSAKFCLSISPSLPCVGDKTSSLPSTLSFLVQVSGYYNSAYNPGWH